MLPRPAFAASLLKPLAAADPMSKPDNTSSTMTPRESVQGEPDKARCIQAHLVAAKPGTQMCGPVSATAAHVAAGTLA